MKNKIISFIRDIYQSVDRMINHDGIEHAGYMSFMILLALFPFFVFLLAFTSFFGASEIGEHFIDLILINMPENAIDSISSRINELKKAPPQSLMTLAILGTIWTSSSFVECLRTILNRVYQIKTPPKYLFRRMLSIAHFFILSIILLVSMIVLIFLPIIAMKIPNFAYFIEKYNEILLISRYFLIFISLFLGVCSFYYIIPNTNIKFNEVAPGALLTVLLWFLSGEFLSRYLIYYNQLSIVYGSLGSIIVTLIFFYIINIIFIIGAEYNYLLCEKRQNKNL